MKAQDKIHEAFNAQLSLFEIEIENEFTPSKKVVPIKGFEERYTISESGEVFCKKMNRFIKPHFHGVKKETIFRFR